MYKQIRVKVPMIYSESGETIRTIETFYFWVTGDKHDYKEVYNNTLFNRIKKHYPKVVEQSKVVESRTRGYCNFRDGRCSHPVPNSCNECRVAHESNF